MNYLGIDFGLKNLGFSISATQLAEPLCQKKYQAINQALNFTTRLIKEYQIDFVVIGLPEGKIAKKVKFFGSSLFKLTNLPVDYQDETLSTYDAKIKMIQAHFPQKKRRQDHQVAAAIILQSYLDNSLYN